MEAHQKALSSFIFVGVLAAILSVILEWRIDIYVANFFAIFSGHRAFLINILIGLVGSSLVASITECIFLKIVKKSKIRDMLLQVRHIKSESNYFYTVDNKEKFLDICLEIKNHFLLFQKDLDILEINFKGKKNFQDMFDFLCKYNGRVAGARDRVRYGKSTYETELAGICGLGENEIAKCLSKWTDLVKQYEGIDTYNSYCDLDEYEISIQELKAVPIRKLLIGGNDNGSHEI